MMVSTLNFYLKWLRKKGYMIMSQQCNVIKQYFFRI